MNALFCLLYTLISQVFPDSYLVNTLGYLISFATQIAHLQSDFHQYLLSYYHG